MTAVLEEGRIPTVSYQENYDAIAARHLAALHAGHGNPFMLAEDIAHFARESAALVDKYTKKGGKVLDAGCGPGELELELDLESFRVTGLDISADYLHHVKNHVAPAVELVEGRIEAMPFTNASFDTVVCVDVLEHVLHLDDCMRELLRVLKPGGHMIVRVPVEASVAEYVLPNPYWFVHLRRFEQAELILLFTRAFGCEVLETPLCPRVDGELPPEIHCVARKP